MDRALLLSFGIMLGVLLIGGGFASVANARATLLRQRILDRFSGEPVAQLALRRDAPRWRISLRAAWLTPGTIKDVIRREAGPPLTILAVFGGFVAANVLRRALSLPVLLAIVAGMAVTVAIILLVIRFRRAKRDAALAEKVPEALDMMVRSLRVGLPISRTIIMVGDETPGPLGEEFREAAYQISYGKDVVTALKELAERTRNQNLGFLATIAAIQQASGGNLAEVLERLAAIARGRQAMQRKIASATAEAQWSGRFLSAFPIIASGGMLLLNPGFFDEVSQTDYFPKLLVVVGMLLVANILFMRKMLKID